LSSGGHWARGNRKKHRVKRKKWPKGTGGGGGGWKKQLSLLTKGAAHLDKELKNP